MQSIYHLLRKSLLACENVVHLGLVLGSSLLGEREEEVVLEEEFFEFAALVHCSIAVNQSLLSLRVERVGSATYC